MENDNLVTETTEDSFAVELGKTVALSLASTAGAWIGLIAVGFAAQKISKARDARRAKKHANQND